MNTTPTPIGAAEELFASIDWTLLRNQKLALIALTMQQSELAATGDAALGRGQIDAIDGIINLIDSIQDVAVDALGYRSCLHHQTSV